MSKKTDNIKKCKIVAVGNNTFSIYFDNYGIEIEGKLNKKDIGNEIKVVYEGEIGTEKFKIIDWSIGK